MYSSNGKFGIIHVREGLITALYTNRSNTSRSEIKTYAHGLGTIISHGPPDTFSMNQSFFGFNGPKDSQGARGPFRRKKTFVSPQDPLADEKLIDIIGKNATVPFQKELRTLVNLAGIGYILTPYSGRAAHDSLMHVQDYEEKIKEFFRT